MSYSPANRTLDASWSGASFYRPPVERTPGGWSAEKALLPVGFFQSQAGTPFVTKQQFATSQGWDSSCYAPPLVTLDWEFVPRFAAVNASWVGAAAYSPATGTRAGQWVKGSGGTKRYLSLVGAIDSCVFGTPSFPRRQDVEVPGWCDTGIGTLLIFSTLQDVEVPGWCETTIGAHGVSPVLNATWEVAKDYWPSSWLLGGSWAQGTFLATLIARGFDAERFQQPAIFNRNQQLSVGGIPSALAFGDPSEVEVYNLDRFVAYSGFVSGAFGTAFMGGGVRDLRANQIAPPFQDQRPWVSFSPRWIDAGDLKPAGVSVPLVGGTRYLEALGFEATLWGDRVIPESQTLYPEGKILSLWGDNRPWNYSSWLLPLPIKWQAEESRFGTQWAWNWQRYVAQYYEHEFKDDFGIWTAIENCDRVIHHHSTAPGYLPMPRIDNGARALLPGGIGFPVLPEYHKSGMVSYRVRNYRMEGVEPPLVSRWPAVYNRARLIQPSGYVASLFGTSLLENTRRNFRYITAGDQQIIPAPMIAYRIREITFESRYGIQPPAIPEQGIKLRVRYLSPNGLESNRFGAAFLEIHWTKFAPMWTHRDLFGEARVKNLTPELHGYGHNSESFGDALVRLAWRGVYPDGSQTDIFGRFRIADRTQIVFAEAIPDLRISEKLKVERTGSYRPEPQWVVQISSHGYEGEQVMPIPKDHGFGKVVMNQQVAYVIEDGVQTKFGSAIVTANSIRVEPGYQDLLVGDPFVSLKDRRISVSEWRESEVFEPSKARVTPHTIWAVMEAPRQAIDNHYGRKLHYVDYSENGYPIKGVGSPAVTLQNRNIGLGYFGTDNARFGKPALSLRTNYVVPEGLSSFRRGYHALSGYERILKCEGFVTEVFGRAGLSTHYRGTQTIQIAGIAGCVSTPIIANFHRSVFRSDSMEREYQPVGANRTGQTPLMPGNISMSAPRCRPFRRGSTARNSDRSGCRLPSVTYSFLGRIFHLRLRYRLFRLPHAGEKDTHPSPHGEK